jgi:NADPH-dependent curcumin reductase CurA
MSFQTHNVGLSMNEETDEITHDVKLVYTDGLSEWFEAIHMTKNGVVIDRIINGKVVACGFISKRNIKEIKFEQIYH